jgi:hypothetical protein
MRRYIGVVVLALGVFFLALAPLLRFYAAPKLVTAPVDEYAKITMTGQNGQYYSADQGRMVQAPLVGTTTLKASGSSTSSTAVWDYFAALDDTSTGLHLALDTWRMAFDRKTAQLKTCCGSTVDGHPRVQQTGVGVQFPVGSVQKKTYQRFDPITLRTWPAVYQGRETVGGLEAYKFTEKIDPTSIGETWGVPGSQLGMDPKGTYDYQKIYSATVTLWVDPRSGVIVDQRQQVQAKLQTLDGIDRVTAYSGDLRVTPASRKAQISKADDLAMKVTLYKTAGPIASLVLGVGLLAAGVLVLRQRRRGEHAATSSPPAITEPAG